MIIECMDLELDEFVKDIQSYEQMAKEIIDLRRKKQEAIDAEQFEILPGIRDRLKTLEGEARERKENLLEIKKMADILE